MANLKERYDSLYDYMAGQSDLLLSRMRSHELYGVTRPPKVF